MASEIASLPATVTLTGLPSDKEADDGCTVAALRHLSSAPAQGQEVFFFCLFVFQNVTDDVLSTEGRGERGLDTPPVSL